MIQWSSPQGWDGYSMLYLSLNLSEKSNILSLQCLYEVCTTLVFLTFWNHMKNRKRTTPSFLKWQSRSKTAGSVNTSALARPKMPMTMIWGRSIFLELVWSVSSRGSVFGWTRQHMQGREIALTIGCCIYTFRSIHVHLEFHRFQTQITMILNNC